MNRLINLFALVFLAAFIPRVAVSGSPQQVKVLHDIAYGSDEKQRMDVYLPGTAVKDAPVIFMVHGGAWRVGDKESRRVVENKVARWVTRGFIFISINYRLLPENDPLRQAEDVAHALATAQAKAASWGGDPAKFILMGHSAGAHLVALLDAAPAKTIALGARPWLGTVALDSAAYDLVTLMQAKHRRLYDKAFGSRKSYWQAASPLHQLVSSAPPLLAVCSSRRKDSCVQAHSFAARCSSLGVHAEVLEQDQSHRGINETLGKPGAYTRAVEKFMVELDTTVKAMLTTPPTSM